jgi:hypothetical protein
MMRPALIPLEKKPKLQAFLNAEAQSRGEREKVKESHVFIFLMVSMLILQAYGILCAFASQHLCVKNLGTRH